MGRFLLSSEATEEGSTRASTPSAGHPLSNEDRNKEGNVSTQPTTDGTDAVEHGLEENGHSGNVIIIDEDKADIENR